jgi:hypothetical protein
MAQFTPPWKEEGNFDHRPGTRAFQRFHKVPIVTNCASRERREKADALKVEAGIVASTLLSRWFAVQMI